jgi:uncharacterized membrane protein (DUF2068 family)
MTEPVAPPADQPKPEPLASSPAAADLPAPAAAAAPTATATATANPAPPAGMPGPLPHTVPGPTPGTVARKRWRPRIDYELVSCGVHGHRFEGVGASEVRVEDADLVRESDGIRWHRCLRCDAWVPFEIPAGGAVGEASTRPPAVADVEVPVRGRRLRDRYVLRLIVLDRILHALVIGLLAVAIFAFAQDRQNLHKVYEKILSVLNSSAGSWWVHELNKLFSISTTKLYLLGLFAAVYTTVLVIECVGLWSARRWAEYLTLIELAVFVPYEVYELLKGVTFFKVSALVVNLIIVAYLLFAHRLFGVRGGRRAAEALYGEGG